MSIYQLGDNAPQIHASAYIADEACVIGKVVVKEKASIWPGAVLRGDNETITLGAHSNIQEGAVLHTDPGYELNVSDRVTIGHQAMLHGCTIGEGSLIGIQAIILNGAVIGKDSLVGAGALVTENKTFPDRSLIIGSPAKAVRTLSDEDIARMHANTDNYAERGAYYKTALIKID